MKRSRLWVGLLLFTGLLGLLATTIPAPFTIDDCNYLSTVAGLRQGTLSLPGTTDLPPSRALYAYEPTAASLRNVRAPVPPLVPPLYAFLAYPFSFLGYYGLVLLNALATVATLLLVYAFARRVSDKPHAGWYAAMFWLLGASTLEYAQGAWPHMAAVSLCTAGIFLVALAVLDDRPSYAPLAGFLLAVAAGLRYQDAILLLAGGLVLVLWHPRRWRACLLYGLGTLVPILVASAVNHARIETWNPFSKGARYLSTNAGRNVPLAWEFLLTLWSRVVDYSAQPAFRDQTSTYLHKLPTGDMVTAWGVLKKSWMQSSPWILLGLVVLLLAWIRRGRLDGTNRTGLRIQLVPVALVLAVFGLAGIYRHDGMGFSQRYLLELTPFVAIAAGIGLAMLPIRWPWFAAGLGLGGLATLLVLLPGHTPRAFRWQSLLPLALALLAAATWMIARVRDRWSGMAGVFAAACLAWGAGIHLATDYPASRLPRRLNDARATLLEEAVPAGKPFAILAASGPLTGFCPLLLTRDVVMVNEGNLAEVETPPLMDALLRRGRVMVWLENFPQASLARLQARYRITPVHPPALVEMTHLSP